MTIKKFQTEFNLELILKLIALVFIVGSAYSKVMTELDILKLGFAEHVKDVSEIKKEYVRVDTQSLRDKRIEEKLDELKVSMDRIEKQTRP